MPSFSGIRRLALLLVPTFLLLAPLGCGGGGTSTSSTPSAPAITTQPQSQTLTAGQTATFTVAASGSPAYQWERSADGTNWSSLGGQTGASYTFIAQRADDGARFRAKASNSAGNALSSAATLTVHYAPGITSQPQSQTATEGTQVTFTSAGTGNPVPAWQWQRSDEGGTNWADVAGAVSASHTFTAQLSQNGARFRVRAANSVGSVESNSAMLSVAPASAPPLITNQPADQTVTAGQTATFTATASGIPAPTYQWQSSLDGASWATIPNATQATHAFIAFRSQDSLRLRLVVTNSAGSTTSTAATLGVTANPNLKVALSPSESEIIMAPGGSRAFTASVDGSTEQSVIWSLDGESLGTLSASGAYQAPGDPVSTLNPVYVVASAAVDPSVQSRAVLRLSPQAAVALATAPGAARDIAAAGETYSFDPGVHALSSALEIQSFTASGPSGAAPTVDAAGLITWVPDASQAGLQTLTLRVNATNGTSREFFFPVEVLQRERIIQGRCGAEGGTFGDPGGNFMITVPANAVAAGASEVEVTVDRLVRQDGRILYRPTYTGLVPDAEISGFRADTPYTNAEAPAIPSTRAQNTAAATENVLENLTKVAVYGGYRYCVGDDQWYAYINPATGGLTQGGKPWDDYYPDTMAALYGADPQQTLPKPQPILFVHGYTLHPGKGDPDGGGKGTWGYSADLARDLADAAGLNPVIYEFKWKTAARFEEQAYHLSQAIAQIRRRWNQPPIVVAHSFGGVLGWTYLCGLAEVPVQGNRPMKSVPFEPGSVKALITIGSPIGGIAWGDHLGIHGSNGSQANLYWTLGKGHADGDLSMPGGRQLTMTGAGGPILGHDGKDGLPITDPIQQGLLKLRSFYAEPVGFLVGRIWNRLPAIWQDLPPVQTLVGRQVSVSSGDGVARFSPGAGDGLISHQGQTFPADSTLMDGWDGAEGSRYTGAYRNTYRMMSFVAGSVKVGFHHTWLQGANLISGIGGSIRHYNEVELESRVGLISVNGELHDHPLRTALVEALKLPYAPEPMDPRTSVFQAGPVTWPDADLPSVPYTLSLLTAKDGSTSVRVLAFGTVVKGGIISREEIMDGSILDAPGTEVRWELITGQTIGHVIQTRTVVWAPQSDLGAVAIPSLQTATVSFIAVVKDQNGNAVAGSLVRVRAGSATLATMRDHSFANTLLTCEMSTDSTGRATYAGLAPATTFTVFVRAAGFQDAYAQVAANGTGEYTLRLQPPQPQGGTFTLPGGATLEMVSIPGDTFMMGRYAGEQDSYSVEDPRHPVTVPAFAMGRYEITQAQWKAIMGSNPSLFTGDDSRPVERVSWNDIRGAGGFLEKLNAATEGQRGGLVFRLPNEAEWEYAARAGTATRFYWGDDPSYTQIGNYAWHYSHGGYTTHPVGQKLPNAFGLYDMSGNVWEWCEDDWHDSYAGAPADGRAWVDYPRGSLLLVRGGSWSYFVSGLRSGLRSNGWAGLPYNDVGFRVVLSPPGTP